MTLVSHRYGLIFLKTEGTGSTAAEIALARVLDRDDAVVTSPVATRFGLDRWRTAKRHTPPRSRLLQAIYQGWRRHDATLIGRSLETEQLMDRLSEYASAAAVQAAVGAASWAAATKVAVVRHPATRLQALWQAAGAPEDREAFLNQLAADGRVQLSPQLSLGDAPAVDRGLPYERLTEAVQALAAQLGMPAPDGLPALAAAHDAAGAPADSTWRAYAARFCPDDFAQFGYTP